MSRFARPRMKPFTSMPPPRRARARRAAEAAGDAGDDTVDTELGIGSESNPGEFSQAVERKRVIIPRLGRVEHERVGG